MLFPGISMNGITSCTALPPLIISISISILLAAIASLFCLIVVSLGVT